MLDFICLLQIASTVSMTLLPDVRGQQEAREGFKVMSKSKKLTLNFTPAVYRLRADHPTGSGRHSLC
jgi:hypothetical protein